MSYTTPSRSKRSTTANCGVRPRITASQQKAVVKAHNVLRRTEGSAGMAKMVCALVHPISLSLSLSRFLSLALSLSVCMSVCLSLNLSPHLSLPLSLSLRICIPLSLSLRLSLLSSLSLSLSLPLSLSLSLSLPICIIVTDVRVYCPERRVRSLHSCIDVRRHTTDQRRRLMTHFIHSSTLNIYNSN